MCSSDYATDTVIQSSLRKELDRGATVVTIAHRLQTSMGSHKIVSAMAVDYLSQLTVYLDGPGCWSYCTGAISLGLVLTLTWPTG